MDSSALKPVKQTNEPNGIDIVAFSLCFRCVFLFSQQGEFLQIYKSSFSHVSLLLPFAEE